MTIEILSGRPLIDKPNISGIPFFSDNRFDIRQTQRNWVSRIKEINGSSFNDVSLATLVIPKKAGIYRIEGQITYVVSAGSGQQNRGFFDSPFFDTPSGKVKTAVLPAVEFTVLDVPEDGRPSDFSGIIGKPQVISSAKPSEVSVGEPIDFVIKISGLTYLGNISPIWLEKQASFVKDFKIQDDGLAGSVEGDTLVFRRTLRAVNDQVTVIPGFSLSFLDTGTGKYDRVETKPIPLKVNPTRIVSFEDGTGGIAVTPDKVELESTSTGIAGNETGMDILNDQFFSAVDAVRKPGWLILLLLPVTVWTGAYTCIRTAERRKRDEGGMRKRKAFGAAKRALRKIQDSSGSAERMAGVLYDYLGDKFGKNSAALTPAESASLLEQAGAPDSLCGQTKSLLDNLEGARFGGWRLDTDPARTMEQILSLLKQMEKVL